VISRKLEGPIIIRCTAIDPAPKYSIANDERIGPTGIELIQRARRGAHSFARLAGDPAHASERFFQLARY
jgi:hypothetical protein